jgi:hypothetical protein
MTSPVRPTVPTLIRAEATTARVTSPGVSGRFRQALSESASVVLGGLEAAAGALPGASIVTAAVRGAGSAGVSASSSGASGSTSAEAGSVENVLAQSADQNLYFLRIQEELQSENRRYSALSNVLKARHETVKNAIGNIR